MALARAVFRSGSCCSLVRLQESRHFSPWRVSYSRHYFSDTSLRLVRNSALSARRPPSPTEYQTQRSDGRFLRTLKQDMQCCGQRESAMAVKRRVWRYAKTASWMGEGVRCISLSSTRSKDFAINVPVLLDDSAVVDPQLQEAVEQLDVDGRLAVKLAIEGNVNLVRYETVELSVMLCSDASIQELNKQWRGKDAPTDVLSFPQDQPPGLTPTLLLGDVVISVDTAAQQAKEWGHTLVDELRILLVHGLLHVLGYDHELGPEASKKMEEEETRILGRLGWKGKGLVSASLEEGVSSEGD